MILHVDPEIIKEAKFINSRRLYMSALENEHLKKFMPQNYSSCMGIWIVDLYNTFTRG
jgi:hypothetical protein